MAENEATPSCPKCDAPRVTKRRDCPRCGLVFDRLPADFDPLWGDANDTDAMMARRLAQRAEEGWDDENAHSRFIDFCRQKGKLDLAIRFYRNKTKEDADDAIAARQLTGLEKIVQFTYIERVEQRRPRDGSKRRRRIIAYVVVIIALGVLVFITMSQFSSISAGGGVSPYSMP